MKHGKMHFLENFTAQKSRASLNNFGYLFPRDLERLDTDNKEFIIKGLTELGQAMTSQVSEDSQLPAFLTYLGQFIDHDLTASLVKREFAQDIDQDTFPVIGEEEELQDLIQNARTGILEIDSLYNTAALDANGKFILGQLEDEDSVEGNDLPRDPNGEALIGDSRNDENLVVAQTHVAFLKFHNAIMDKEGVDSQTARKIATQHYQWIIIHDFLKQLVDYNYVQQALIFGNRFFHPTASNFFLPLEFSMAAYRLGHSMVRDSYDWNEAVGQITLAELFQFGELGGQVPPPLERKIDWRIFKENKAKKLDGAIIDPLAAIPTLNINLAVRNLRRGYMFGLPTGQGVAKRILFDESLVLAPDELLEQASPAEKTVLETYHFHQKTPLWYYILKEAQIREQGEQLGPVGTVLVTEVLLQSIKLAPFSILQESNWQPSLGTTFGFVDMLQYSGLLEDMA